MGLGEARRLYSHEVTAFIALVDRERIATRATIHFRGVPEDMAGAGMEPMPHPDVVLLEGHPDGPMMYRYTAQGEFGGDTWHETLDDAKKQAMFEYGDALGEWMPVPTEASDAHEFAITAARQRAPDADGPRFVKPS